jgi:hypothetical protein
MKGFLICVLVIILAQKQHQIRLLNENILLLKIDSVSTHKILLQYNDSIIKSKENNY